MEHEQDGIVYKIKDGLIKGWKGASPFKIPFWDAATKMVIEGAPNDYEAVQLAAAKARKISQLHSLAVEKLRPYEYYRIQAVFDKTKIPGEILGVGEVIFADVAAKTAAINSLTTIQEVNAYAI